MSLILSGLTVILIKRLFRYIRSIRDKPKYYPLEAQTQLERKVTYLEFSFVFKYAWWEPLE